jgi:hypothetical protein
VILDLKDGKHVAVHNHSGKIWLTAYNGCGTVNELSFDEAQELGLAIYFMGRKGKRGK